MSILPGRRAAGLVLAPALAGSILALLPPAPASADASADDMAAAIAADADLVTGASYVRQPAPASTTVATASLSGFPTDGTSYGVLSSGDADQVFADDPDLSTPFPPQAGDVVEGNPDQGEALYNYDRTTLLLELDVPAWADCLALDAQFVTNEHYETMFVDGFLAQLDATTWVSDSASRVIDAPGNFATIGGVPVAAGRPLAWERFNEVSLADELWTPGRRRFTTSVTPGAHQLALSIFDAGDRSGDSFALIDGLYAGVAEEGGTCRRSTAPTLELPDDITAEATGPDGAVVEYVVSASDDTDPELVPSCSPASGEVFAIGVTEVTCSVEDSEGATATGSFTVTVVVPDGDEDGVPDYVEEEQGTDPADPDSDSDGLNDGEETVGEDVCASGTTDALDPDTDGDGLEDGPEIAGVVVKQRVEKRNGSVRIGLVRTDGCARDTDGDGLRDSREVGGVTIRQEVLSGGKEKDGPEHWFTYVIGKRFTDPTRADTDNDGRSDGQEVAGRKYRGQLKRTDPTNWDTDRGGASDSREIAVGSDPTDISSGPKRPRMGHRSVG